MASSSSRSAVCPRENRYDVFLSFRGEDTRNQFVSHLCAALRKNNILTFVDDKLERGSEISPTLRKAVDESTISVVILSENFASSTWCLDELVQIVESKKTKEQIVMPIFYGIDPSVVRKQEGSCKDAFAALEERFKDRMEKVDQWRAALTEVANLCGLVSKEFSRETQLIDEVVADVLSKLPKYSSWNIKHSEERLFGIPEHMEKIENLLAIGSEDVRIVGIWGMGGIGKTTLASVVFQTFSYFHFEGSSFLWDVRKDYERLGPNSLRKKLLAGILKDEAAAASMDSPFVASPFIQKRLEQKKVLIVLDDVDTAIQLDALIGGYEFGPGSRIIVTSRDRQVLVKVVDHGSIYKVEGLNDIESLKLLQLHAFKENSMAIDYQSLSERVANYAKGNPLALKVLGSFLCKSSKKEWESALEKLRKDSNGDILEVLRISYGGLKDRRIQSIFLDIACLFDRPFTREFAESILDDGDSSATIRIRVLIDKALIENCPQDGSRFQVHDLIRQMAWSIVSDEHREPGNRSRLWDANDVYHVLETNTGTEAVEGIVFNMSKIKGDAKVSHTAFSKMCKLRILNIYCDDSYSNKCKLDIPRKYGPFLSNELRFASNKLRYFRWDLYPLKYLPSEFALENLVELRLRHSHLVELGNNVVKSLPKLRKLDLSYSKLLTRLPDLSQAPNLERIDLAYCTSLSQILPSIRNLDKLTELNLSGCTNLRDLEEMPGGTEDSGLVKHGHVRNLVTNNFPLIFASVKGSIVNFVTMFLPYASSPSYNPPKFPINLTELNLRETSIEELPSSLCCISGLVSLYLDDCKRLRRLPPRIYELKSLEVMSLDGCSKLEEFPKILEPMERLGGLYLDDTAIKTLPESIENLINLYTLSVSACEKLQSLPSSLSKLSELRTLCLNNCSGLETLSSCPLDLMDFLSVRGCWRLKLISELPSCLKSLDISGCTSLEAIRGWTSSPLAHIMLKSIWSTGKRLNRPKDCLWSGQDTCIYFKDDDSVARRPGYRHGRNKNVKMVRCSCPGDEILNDFGHQCLGDSLTIPPHWNSDDLAGVVFCMVLEFTNVFYSCDANYAIHGQIHDDHAYKYDFYVSFGELYIRSCHSDPVLTWYTTKHLEGWDRFHTCSNVTKFSFQVKASLYDHKVLKYVDVGSENLKIKKCGIQLVYKKDLAQFANSDIDEFAEASGNRVVGSCGDYDEEMYHGDGSPSTSNPSTKRRFDGWEQDDDGDGESQGLINSKKLKLVQF